MSPNKACIIFSIIATIALARVPTYSDTKCRSINIEGVYIAGPGILYVNATNADIANDCGDFPYPQLRVYDRNTDAYIGTNAYTYCQINNDITREVNINTTAITIAVGDSVSLKIEAWGNFNEFLGCSFNWCGIIGTKADRNSIASPCLTPTPTAMRLTALPTETIECTTNEVFTECNGHCRPTCATGTEIFCTLMCQPGCNCKEGYILSEYGGECIPIEECPTEEPVVTEECGVNEIFTECHGHCRPTCDTGLDIMCTFQCQPGCNCKEGYILDEYNGECIPINECPTTTECGENEVYDECGTACPGICGQDAPMICTLQCVIGCRCKEGFILDEEDGVCISQAKCLGISTEEPLSTESTETDIKSTDVYGSDANVYGLFIAFAVAAVAFGWI